MRVSTKGTYYGEKKSELEVGRGILSEYDYNHSFTEWHYHENPYFMYVLRGDVLDLSKEKTCDLSGGSLIFHNWQEPHWNKNEGLDTRGFHVEFERKWFEENKLDISLWEGSKIVKDPKVHHVLAKIYAEFRCQDEFSSLSIEILLLELCEKVNEEMIYDITSMPSWVPRLRELVIEGNCQLTLASLSAELGVHPVHISRSVPKYLSSTLGGFIREQRVKRCFPLLLDTRLSLTEIAYICGFTDQSHFIRNFKSYFQMTPKEYRKRIRS